MFTCGMCGVEKPETAFCKDRRIKRGYRSSCKECSRVPVPERYDEVVVYRILLGDHPGVRTSPREKIEVVRRMTKLGYSQGQIAYALRIRPRSVCRIRSENGFTRPRGAMQVAPTIPKHMRNKRKSEIFGG